MTNPWQTGETEIINGKRIRPAWIDASSRLDRVKAAGIEKLRAMIAWPDTQKTVRLAAERRLRKLLKSQQPEHWKDECRRCSHFRATHGGTIWRCRIRLRPALYCAEAKLTGLCSFNNSITGGR